LLPLKSLLLLDDGQIFVHMFSLSMENGVRSHDSVDVVFFRVWFGFFFRPEYLLLMY
jgi:hypothetical protein